MRTSDRGARAILAVRDARPASLGHGLHANKGALEGKLFSLPIFGSHAGFGEFGLRPVMRGFTARCIDLFGALGDFG